MSILGRQISARAIVGMIAGMVAVQALLPVFSKERGREVALVARDMAFYLEGDTTPNPVIDARPGETLRVVFRHRDRGMTHDFAVPAISAALDPIDWDEEADLVFTAPTQPGTYEYICRPHAQMMRGTLRVR